VTWIPTSLSWFAIKFGGIGEPKIGFLSVCIACIEQQEIKETAAFMCMVNTRICAEKSLQEPLRLSRAAMCIEYPSKISLKIYPKTKVTRVVFLAFRSWL
jgi:hypothetical protein